jgi:hypothetical protein
MRKEWVDQVKLDPEIGSKLDSVKANIGRALQSAAKGDAKLITDFKSALDLTGAGDHPAVIKMINRWADLVNEGTHVSGAGPSPEGQIAPGRSNRPTLAEAMYPNLATARR